MAVVFVGLLNSVPSN